MTYSIASCDETKAHLKMLHLAPEERERVFGQFDHVREYGLDYKDRLKEAGFTVKVDPYAKMLGPE